MLDDEAYARTLAGQGDRLARELRTLGCALADALGVTAFARWLNGLLARRA